MSFPAYEDYRRSGGDWLGEVPTTWSVAPIKVIASCNDEVLPDSTPDDFEIRYVEISDVSLARGIEGSTDFLMAAAPSRARRRLQDGDILISTVRTYLKAIASVRDPAPNLIASTGFAVIRPRRCRSDFLGYALQAEHVIAEIISRSVGVSYPAINASDLIAIKVPIPSPKEQALIATFLNRETAKIDALVEEQRRLIELLKEKRQAAISHAVTKGLDATAPMKGSSVEWVGEIPAHWDVKRLKSVAQIQTGVAKGKDASGRETQSVPYLRVANVQDGRIDLTEVAMIDLPVDEIERYLLRPGDVLMNEGGDFDKLGRGGIWDGAVARCVHQNHVFAVRPFAVSPGWLNFTTTSDAARFFFMGRSKQSTNLASISSTNLMELPLLVPPLAEQDAIVQRLSETCRQIDDLSSEAELAITLLQERRSALISAAVTGKIDVRGLAPAAEAA